MNIEDSKDDRETARPPITIELYNAAKKYCVDKRLSPKDLFEYAFSLIFTEDGEMREGVQRLEKHCEVHGGEEDAVLNKILTEVIDEDGDMNIKYKGKIDVDDV